ncbi:MAG: hypothetical protein KGH65_03675 [Candidatus Micrarchaeota archaeon]|nr:hypothetical protein [Candidatus Micrarchaeota archaeon]
MSDYDMSGILFKNDRKTKDNQPDYQGKLTVNGIEYRLAGWQKHGQKGPFLSLRVSLPQERAPAPKSEARSEAKPEFTDSIPF